jgi:ABC-2 type transport system ATP-binding protein
MNPRRDSIRQVGEETVVILSTHIVDDVEELCSQVAIMGRGQILKVGEPQQMIRELNGKLWTLVVKREEVPEMRARHTVLSTRLRAGFTEIRVLSDTQPEGMQPVAPELEDVYFSTLIAHSLMDNLE